MIRLSTRLRDIVLLIHKNKAKQNTRPLSSRRLETVARHVVISGQRLGRWSLFTLRTVQHNDIQSDIVV